MLYHAQRNSRGGAASQRRQIEEWLERLDQEPSPPG
jgi:hypothetical protein